MYPIHNLNGSILGIDAGNKLLKRMGEFRSKNIEMSGDRRLIKLMSMVEESRIYMESMNIIVN